jgi:HTH-type transcriptional regulator/antitoxin HigA
VLKAESLDELPNVLIRARIARGLSQRELADALGLKEQQIQRYEAEQYASAALRRLIDIANALNLSISEVAALGR